MKNFLFLKLVVLSRFLPISDAAIQVEVPIVRRGPTTRSGTRAIREGFSKAVQQILDQDGQTDQNQLLIEDMCQLKIQDPTGPMEVHSAGPIQFTSFSQNQAGLNISISDLNSNPILIPSNQFDSGSEI